MANIKVQAKAKVDTRTVSPSLWWAIWLTSATFSVVFAIAFMAFQNSNQMQEIHQDMLSSTSAAGVVLHPRYQSVMRNGSDVNNHVIAELHQGEVTPDVQPGQLEAIQKYGANVNHLQESVLGIVQESTTTTPVKSPNKCEVADQLKTQQADLLAWMINEGASFPNIELVQSSVENSRGVVATEDMPEGEVLVHIPERFIINFST